MNHVLRSRQYKLVGPYTIDFSFGNVDGKGVKGYPLARGRVCSPEGPV